MLAALLAPMVVLVSSARGETRVPVRLDARGGPVLAAPLLLPAVGGRAVIGEGWADVTVGPRTFRFILGAPLFRLDGKLQTLVGSASLRRDTLQLPIQFVSEILPRALLKIAGERFLVGCGQESALELITVQPEGKKRTSARDFANGYQPRENELLGQ